MKPRWALWALAIGSRALAADEAEVAIEVVGESDGAALRRSSDAVQVVDTERAQLESADLGEVLARSSGVAVQRTGGLGSEQRFSLNGLTDHQIRFFLDGVPLSLSGYPFGLANVPVAFVDRVEVYRGVVPIRFGADALGGAVNLVGADAGRASASLQVGSFDTIRTTVGARQAIGATGLYVRAAGFLDHAANDYPVQVEVPDAVGRPVEAKAYRFHDGYAARGGQLELGLTDQRWADRVFIRAFGTALDRDIQNNPSMTVPYGDVTSARQAVGGMIRHELVLPGGPAVDVVGGVSRSRSDFVDNGRCIYDWFGQCVRERQSLGEIAEGQPLDQSLYETAAYARVNTRWAPSEAHSFGLAVAPTWIDRDGEDHLNLADDWYSSVEAERSLLTGVVGLDHRGHLFAHRLEATTFAKAYLQTARSNEPVIGLVERELDRSTRRLGGGEALRWRFADPIYAKLSYEFATRLPEADEVFGDAQLVNEHLELRPEVSHNVNVELTVERADTPLGVFRGMTNAFLRETQDQIVLLAAYGQRFRYENVFEARSVGVEGALGYTAPGGWLDVAGNTTYVDLRNRSDEGPFALFVGDRIPNRPWLFVNGTAQLQATDVFAPGDVLSLRWHTRWSESFYEFWESAGTGDSKRTIPAQLTHTVALTLGLLGDERRLTLSGEVQNLTDERVYDMYGVQRPGRAIYFKTTAEF